MKKIEIALCILSIIALKLDLLFLLPGGGLFVILFLTLASLFYFWFGFALFNNIGLRGMFKKSSYTNVSTKRIWVGILTGWALSIAIMGILFKHMTWPGAGFNLQFSIICLAIIGLVGLLKYSKSKAAFYPVIFKRVMVIGGIALIVWLIPADVMIRFKNRDHPAYAEALVKAQANPDNPEYQEELEKQRSIAFPE